MAASRVPSRSATVKPRPLSRMAGPYVASKAPVLGSVAALASISHGAATTEKQSASNVRAEARTLNHRIAPVILQTCAALLLKPFLNAIVTDPESARCMHQRLKAVDAIMNRDVIDEYRSNPTDRRSTFQITAHLERSLLTIMRCEYISAYFR